MKVLIAGRKSKDPSRLQVELPSGPLDFESPIRTPFATVITQSTVLITACPLTPETRNLISESEIALMPPSTVIINVSRGGVVNEAALASALKEHRIAGAASDVFTTEPAGPNNSPLLDLGQEVNFVASPHVAWFSKRTIKNVQKKLKNNVECWAAGKPENVMV
jgi:glycerate dehydrogenase